MKPILYRLYRVGLLSLEMNLDDGMNKAFSSSIDIMFNGYRLSRSYSSIGVRLPVFGHNKLEVEYNSCSKANISTKTAFRSLHSTG